MNLSLNKLSVTIIIFLIFIASVFAQQPEGKKGIELYENGDFPAAIKALKESNGVNELYYLGLAYEKEGEKGKAKDAFKKSFALSFEIFRKSLVEWQKVPISEEKQRFSDLLQKFELNNRVGMAAAEKAYSLDAGFFQNEWRIKARVLSDLNALTKTRTEIYTSSDNLTSKIKIIEKPRLQNPRDNRDIPYMRPTQVIGKPIIVRLLVVFGADEKIKLAFPTDDVIDPYTTESLKAVRGTKFKSAIKEDKPVDYRSNIEYSFTI